MNASQTPGDASIRSVAGRLFALQEGVWNDTSSTTDGRMIRIEPYSRAYFDLLQALPEIRSWWSAFQRVHRAAGGLVPALEPGGSGEPTESKIRRIAEEFLQDEPTRP